MASPAPDLDGISWFRFLIASSTTVALMGALALGLKYLASKGMNFSGHTKNRRLHIVESLALDMRRRLVIVRCDNKEHLLLLGPQCDSVVAADLNAPPESPRSL